MEGRNSIVMALVNYVQKTERHFPKTIPKAPLKDNVYLRKFNFKTV